MKTTYSMFLADFNVVKFTTPHHSQRLLFIKTDDRNFARDSLLAGASIPSAAPSYVSNRSTCLDKARGFLRYFHYLVSSRLEAAHAWRPHNGDVLARISISSLCPPGLGPQCHSHRNSFCLPDYLEFRATVIP